MDSLPDSPETILQAYHYRPTDEICLRFGQWFINHYDREASNPSLFYERNTDKVLEIITDTYYKKDVDDTPS